MVFSFSLRLRSVVVLLVLGMGSGCSLVFVNPPPPNHEELNYFTCTESVLAPVLDSVYAGSMLLTTGSVLLQEEGEGDDPLLVASLLLMTAGVSSVAAYGWLQVDKCVRARTALRARLELARHVPSGAPIMAPYVLPPATAGPHEPVPVVQPPTKPSDEPTVEAPEPAAPAPAATAPATSVPAATEPATPVPAAPIVTAPTPAPTPIVGQPEQPESRRFGALLLGVLRMGNTGVDQQYAAVTLGVRAGVVFENAAAFELVAETTADDQVGLYGFGASGFYPFWAGQGGPHSRPALGAALALKYVDMSWGRPRVSGFSVQPGLSLRLRTRWNFNPRLDLGWEQTLFYQAPRRILIPKQGPGRMAHGLSVSMGLEF